MKTQLPKKSKSHEAAILEIRDEILGFPGEQVAFIILFGSFARGDWVYDAYVEDGIRYEYASDYDFLILTRKPKQGSRIQAIKFKDDLRKRLKEYGRPYKSHTPTIIIESLQGMNKALEKGQYFFSEIRNQGVVLYDCGLFELQEAKPLNLEEMKEQAKKYFAQWFVSSEDFLNAAIEQTEKGKNNLAAFLLHQTAESLLNCTLLVFTGYKPKLHDLEELLKLCASDSPHFLGIFPLATEEEKRCFELLQEAYIGARYDVNYTITSEQLQYLISRVEKLRDVVAKVCRERI